MARECLSAVGRGKSLVRLALTIVLAIPAVAGMLLFRLRNATAEAGHIAGLACLAGIVSWIAWVTVALMWLIWR
jgi:hypothetical protein